MVNHKVTTEVIRVYKDSNPKANQVALSVAVATVMNAIQHINSLDEYAVKYDDFNMLSEIKIPNELKDFVIPSAIRRDVNNVACKNVVVVDNPSQDYEIKDKDGKNAKASAVPTLAEINKAIATIRMSQRKGVNDDLVEVSTLRSPATIADVFGRLAIVDSGESVFGLALKCHTDGKPIIPILVDEAVFGTEEDWYFNAFADGTDTLIKNFISSKVSGLN